MENMNMINVESFVKSEVKDNFDLVSWIVENKDLAILDMLDYLASQDMEDADHEFLEDLQSDPYFMDKVWEAVDNGMVRPDTDEERLRQGYFLLRKETYTKLIEDYNLVVMAVLTVLDSNHHQMTQDQIEAIDSWVNDQDWGTSLDDMIQYCDQYLLGEE